MSRYITGLLAVLAIATTTAGTAHADSIGEVLQARIAVEHGGATVRQLELVERYG